MGMDANTAAGVGALCAVIGLGIVPLIFFFIEKDSQFVKFHSLQAVLLIVTVGIICFVASLLSVVLIGFLLFPLAIVPWVFNIIQCIKAFGGEAYKAPVIGNLAEQWSGGSGG